MDNQTLNEANKQAQAGLLGVIIVPGCSRIFTAVLAMTTGDSRREQSKGVDEARMQAKWIQHSTAGT